MCAYTRVYVMCVYVYIRYAPTTESFFFFSFCTTFSTNLLCHLELIFPGYKFQGIYGSLVINN